MIKKIFKKIVSFVLSLCLLLSGLGFSSTTAYAEGETQTGSVIYVNSASDSEDLSDPEWGYSENKPMKTLRGAYGKVPQDNVKTTIVVMDEVTLAPETASNEAGWAVTDLDHVYYRSSEANDWYTFPVHTGEVIITSKIGDTVYENGA
ncbi:MAG: hypothetical protein IKK03_15475, partial [Lachnospiraceae bacterium]|nr:hypothetical protein [Lachnospiraceae bacterium]